MPEKGARDVKELYTISEIANLFHISTQTLRYYDKIGLLNPEAVNPETNYRQYEQGQIARLAMIIELKQMGFSLLEIRKYCNVKRLDELEHLLGDKRRELKGRIEELISVEQQAEFYLKMIRLTREKHQDHILEISYLPRRHAYFIPVSFGIQDLDQYIAMVYKSYMRSGQRKETSRKGHVILSIDEESLRNQKFRTYSGIGLLTDSCVEGKNSLLIQEGLYATAAHIGEYYTISNTYRKLCSYIRENHYEIAGSSLETSVTNISITDNPDEFLTEIQIPVKQK